MKKFIGFVAIFILAGGFLVQAGSDEATLIKFETMFGVVAPFTGATNATQGVPGAGAPWTNPSFVEGKLNSEGRLKISVRGLVLVSTGANPAATFRGIVSCRSLDPSTTPPTPTTVVVTTAAFPASSSGDSEIKDDVALPNPCIAPIVFVGPGTGTVRWFSVTGFSQ